jgi:hypothetical protein
MLVFFLHFFSGKFLSLENGGKQNGGNVRTLKTNQNFCLSLRSDAMNQRSATWLFFCKIFHRLVWSKLIIDTFLAANEELYLHTYNNVASRILRIFLQCRQFDYSWRSLYNYLKSLTILCDVWRLIMLAEKNVSQRYSSRLYFEKNRTCSYTFYWNYNIGFLLP